MIRQTDTYANFRSSILSKFNIDLDQVSIPDGYKPALYAFLASRVVVFFVAYFSEIMIVTGRENNPEFYHIAKDNVFLDVLARWDSGFYITIVDGGYEMITGQISNIAFFPLYPLLISFTNIFFDNTLLSGIIVSHVAFFFALVYLYRLTLLVTDDNGTAQRTIYYLSVFPTAFFFSAVYTESLFLCLSVAAIYYAKIKKWEIATIFTLLVGVTRITGILVFGVVGLEWLASHGWTISTCYKKEAWVNLWEGIKEDWFNLSLLLLAPLGFFSHMMFLNNQFQDPIAFWSVQSAFNRQADGPVAIFLRDFGPLLSQNFWIGDIWWNVLFDSIAIIFALGAAPFVYKRFGEGMALFIVLSVLVPLASGTGSMTRYILVLFPLFMMLGIWGTRPSVDRFFQTFFPTFMGLLTAVFVNWVFVA
ncbi:MAG: mannosyltransferase family protein [Chloroflexota bacterium]